MLEKVGKYLGKLIGKTTAEVIALLFTVLMLETYTELLPSFILTWVAGLLIFTALAITISNTISNHLNEKRIVKAKTQYIAEENRKGNFIDSETLKAQYKEETLTEMATESGKVLAAYLVDKLKGKLDKKECEESEEIRDSSSDLELIDLGEIERSKPSDDDDDNDQWWNDLLNDFKTLEKEEKKD